MRSLFIRPVGSGIERARVLERRSTSPGRARRVPPAVDRHVEVVRLTRRHDDVVPGGRQLAAGLRGSPTDDVTVARLDPTGFGRFLPRPDLAAGTLADDADDIAVE